MGFGTSHGHRRNGAHEQWRRSSKQSVQIRLPATIWEHVVEQHADVPCWRLPHGYIQEVSVALQLHSWTCHHVDWSFRNFGYVSLFPSEASLLSLSQTNDLTYNSDQHRQYKTILTTPHYDQHHEWHYKKYPQITCISWYISIHYRISLFVYAAILQQMWQCPPAVVKVRARYQWSCIISHDGSFSTWCLPTASYNTSLVTWCLA